MTTTTIHLIHTIDGLLLWMLVGYIMCCLGEMYENKEFPKFKDKNQRHLLLICMLIGFGTIIIALAAIIKDWKDRREEQRNRDA